MIKKLFRVWVLVLFIFGAWSAIADEVTDLYQVEVIFFEHKDSKRFEAEQWPKSIGTLNTEGAIKLNNIKGGVPDSVEVLQTLDALDDLGRKPVQKIVPETITIVDTQHQFLKKELATIKSSKDQRFIQYFAWTQPLIPYGKATPILLEAEKGNNNLEAIVDVKLVRNQFDMHLDIIFKTDTHNRSGVQEFRIKRDIKLKRREVVYIDHPLIGAMVAIVPVLVEY